MTKTKMKRIVRKATTTEQRRHKKIRQQTDTEFAPKRKSVSKTRVILAKLRSKRELMGISLSELSKRTGMTRSNLSRLEHNGENAKLQTLERYASGLECELVIDLCDSTK